MTTFLLAFTMGLTLYATGVVSGWWISRRSLVEGSESPAPTPHKLGDGFYYVVPEAEYVLMRKSVMLSKYRVNAPHSWEPEW